MDEALEYKIGVTITQLNNLGRYAFVADAVKYLRDLLALCKAQEVEIQTLDRLYKTDKEEFIALTNSTDTIIADQQKQIAELRGEKATAVSEIRRLEGLLQEKVE